MGWDNWYRGRTNLNDFEMNESYKSAKTRVLEKELSRSLEEDRLATAMHAELDELLGSWRYTTRYEALELAIELLQEKLDILKESKR